MIKLFHTGDIHLDSAYSRLSPAEKARAREHERKIFTKMIDHVRREKYALLLISGDLFDSGSISPETERCVLDAFASLECPVVISPGNHDSFLSVPFYSSKALPENVYIFNSPEIQCFEFTELSLRVCGYAFMNNSYRENPLDSFSLPAFSGITVLCAHGELGVPLSTYAPLRESDIEKCNITYAALGHIHKTQEPIRRGGTLIAYSSFLEGRAYDEDGEGGALEVTIDERGAHTRRVCFSEKFYRTETLDVDGVQSSDESLARIKERVEASGYGRETALRLILRGAVPAELVLDTKTPELLFGERLLAFEVLDQTTPLFCTDSLENDYTLRGEVYRTLKPHLSSEDEYERRLAADALRYALLAIDGESIGGKI